MRLNKFNGFTLAEVLITLGIIGIVAAMTLPALVGKYKDKVLVTQVKKHTRNFKMHSKCTMQNMNALI